MSALHKLFNRAYKAVIQRAGLVPPQLVYFDYDTICVRSSKDQDITFKLTNKFKDHAAFFNKFDWLIIYDIRRAFPYFLLDHIEPANIGAQKRNHQNNSTIKTCNIKQIAKNYGLTVREMDALYKFALDEFIQRTEERLDQQQRNRRATPDTKTVLSCV